MQAIAAYSPNEYFASLVNPIAIGTGLITFCGVLVPYSYIQPFWRYWLYYLDPFTYLVGALVTPVTWDASVQCLDGELTDIPLPANSTCGEYMSDFLSDNAGYVVDATSSTSCEYCPYSTGGEYLKTFNINAKYYGWRDVSDAPFNLSLMQTDRLSDRNHLSLLHLVVCAGILDDEASKQGHEDGIVDFWNVADGWVDRPDRVDGACFPGSRTKIRNAST